jgi:RNA polymerase sigma-70 factor (ECF subfamily)
MTDSSPQPAGPALSKQTLLDAAEGDPQAWEMLVRTYTPRVLGLLTRQCGDRDLAEEITQATFVKIVSKLGKFNGYQEQGRFEPWLFRIAMNQLRDEMRRRKRQAVPMDMTSDASRPDHPPSAWAAAQGHLAASNPAASDQPADLLSRREQLQQLRDAINALGESDRQVLYLRHTAGLSFIQIAQTLDQPMGTVLARTHRAMKKLRKALDDSQPRADRPTAP